MPGPAEKARNPVLFVSYSHSDRSYVDPALLHLKNAAESCGLDCFLDHDGMQAGDNWSDEIKDHLQRARAAVVFLSTNYLDRERYAASELEQILARKAQGKLTCFVVLVNQVDEHLPKELAPVLSMHWALPKPIAPMGKNAREAAFRRLNKIIGRQLGRNETKPKTREELAKSEVRRTLDRKYEIHEMLGGGRSSVIFRAQDTVLKRDVAIKVLLPRDDETAFAEEFKQSAEAAACLSHWHIAHMLTSQLQSEPYYVVMECIPDTLEKLVSAGALDRDEALMYFDQVASALEAIHKTGRYHGAIRPANVLLDEANRRAVLSVHCQREATAASSGLTPEELTYLTPEEHRRREMDERTDQYQLGQLLWELLTGQPPARATMLADFFGKKQALLTAQDPLTVLGSALDSQPGLRDALAKMLNNEPGARWTSIREARRSVREAAEGTYTMARASFDRCAEGTKFFERIYNELFAARVDLKGIFHGRKTDLDLQYRRLRAALLSLFEAGKKTVAALSTIDAYAKQHVEMGIQSKDYDDFLEAIVRAASTTEGDRWSPALAAAWRDSLATGINRMKEKSAPERAGAELPEKRNRAEERGSLEA